MSVGIDIGSKTIKIIELASEGQSFKLRASGMVGYSGSTPDKIKDSQEFASLSGIIKKLHREAKISSKDISIALPEQQVYTRTVKFPLLEDSEISSAVKWEAEQYIPIPIKEAVIQHEIIEKRKDSSPPQAVVLLIAVQRKIVENYSKVIEMAGLKLHTVETELISLVRSLAPMDQTVMIVDFGAKSTDIAISKLGQLMFSRSIPTAGDAFTRAVSQGLGVEKQQADEYKKSYGMSTEKLEGKVKSSMMPVFQLVSDELKKTIHFYQQEEQGQTPTSIILTGGTSGMPNVSALLTKMSGIEVVVGNPFAKVNVDPQVVGSLSGYAPFYSVAVGLAMRK